MAFLTGRDKAPFQHIITTDNYYFVFVVAHSYVDPSTKSFPVEHDMLVCHTAEVGAPSYFWYAPFFKNIFYKKNRNLTTNVIFGEYGPRAEVLKEWDPELDKYKYFNAFFPGDLTLDKYLTYDDKDIKNFRVDEKWDLGISVYDPQKTKTEFYKGSDAFMKDKWRSTTEIIAHMNPLLPGRFLIFFFLSCSSVDAGFETDPKIRNLGNVLAAPFFTQKKNEKIPSLPSKAEEEPEQKPFTLILTNIDNPAQKISLDGTHTFFQFEMVYDFVKTNYIPTDPFVIYFTDPVTDPGQILKIWADPDRRFIDYDIPNIESWAFHIKIFSTEAEAEAFKASLNEYELPPTQLYKNYKNPFFLQEPSSLPLEGEAPVNLKNLAKAEGVGVLVTPPLLLHVFDDTGNSITELHKFSDPELSQFLGDLSSLPNNYTVVPIFKDTFGNYRSLHFSRDFFLGNIGTILFAPPSPGLPSELFGSIPGPLPNVVGGGTKKKRNPRKTRKINKKKKSKA